MHTGTYRCCNKTKEGRPGTNKIVVTEVGISNTQEVVVEVVAAGTLRLVTLRL